MFGLLKRKNKDKEVTTNPDILYDSEVNISEIKVHGLKLQDSADIIPIEHISTTTFEKYPFDGLYFPDGGTRRTWRDNKVFYETVNGQKEYLLKDRIKAVIDFGGILHMKSGAKYVIRNRKIVGIGIHQNIVEPYQKIHKNKVEKKFGKASKIIEDIEQTDGELWSTSYFYESRSMEIIFFEPDKRIECINIGVFPYSIDN